MKSWHLGFNLLGFWAGCLMAISMFFPWWSFRWSFVEQTDIFPYLVSGPGSEFVGYHRSPEMTLLTGVLIACILICLAGSLLRGRVAMIMMGASGLVVLVAAWRLLARVSGVAERFGLPAVGHGWGSLGGFAKVETWTWLQPGLYIVAAGGILAILAALLHRKIRIGG